MMVPACGFLLKALRMDRVLYRRPVADRYEPYIRKLSHIATPTIVPYEVYKKVKQEMTEEAALTAVSVMNRTSVVPLSESIALYAADLSLQYSLPMADTVAYATALELNCGIATSNANFRGLEKVVFIPQS